MGLNGESRVPAYVRKGRQGWQILVELLSREENSISVKTVSDLYFVSRRTVYRWTKEVSASDSPWVIEATNGKARLRYCDIDVTESDTDVTKNLTPDSGGNSLKPLFSKGIQSTPDIQDSTNNVSTEKINKQSINIKQNRLPLVYKYIDTTFAHAREVDQVLVYLIVQTWNAVAPKADLPIHYKKHMERGDKLPRRMRNPILEAYREYTPRQIIKAILNFGCVKASEDTWWSWRCNLKKFLKRVLVDVVDRDLGQLLEDYCKNGRRNRKKRGNVDWGNYE